MFLIPFFFQKCPYEAIKIINLPSNLAKDTTHRFSKNSFKLHRLPTPRTGEVPFLYLFNGFCYFKTLILTVDVSLVLILGILKETFE